MSKGILMIIAKGGILDGSMGKEEMAGGPGPCLCLCGRQYLAGKKGSAGGAGTPSCGAAGKGNQRKAPRITIYISGAVQEPGLYQVPPGIRFQEALAEAGGVTEEADLTRVNLARKCKDGCQINVPFLKKKAQKAGTAPSSREAVPSAGAGNGPGQGAARRINLNQAGVEELTELPGIGPALARRIVEYRKTQPFRKAEDLQQVSGIGPAKFQKLREWVEV